MKATLRISGKVLGKTQAMFTDWEMVVQTEADRPLTLGELITQIVAAQVTAFTTRQDQQTLPQAWSLAQVVIGLELGKVAPGDRDPSRDLAQEAAIATALQGFRDGLYLVFVDEVQQLSLDQAVTLREASQVLLLRLVALVGG